MEPIRMRIKRIMDFGTIVSIVGIDIESNQPVMVHVDHRPFQAIWDSWKAANFPQPVAFDAQHLILNLEVGFDDEEDNSSNDALPPAA